jgi:DNA polymerase I-like protein with 3'-5' exonuclease and polymerase domains
MKLYQPNVQYIGLLDGARQMFQPEFEDFIMWVYSQKSLQLDVETNVTEDVKQRKLITVQFGSCYQKHNQQWVFQWSYLNPTQQRFIKKILESEEWEKLIHNAQFELVVFLNYDIHIRNIYDTLLAERVIWCGYSGANQISAELDQITIRRLGYNMITGRPTYLPEDPNNIYIDEGKNFGDNIITKSKLRYAALDVLFLDVIKKQQLLDLHLYDLEYVAALENEAVIGFAQMMWEGMDLDRDEWLSNVEWAMPMVEEAEQKLNQWLTQEPFKTRAIKLGYINVEDKVLLNWKSNTHKALVTSKLFGITGVSKAVINKWMVNAVKQPDYDVDLVDVAYYMTNGTQDIAGEYLLKNHKDWMIENELFRPAGTAIINWNSPDQVLPLIQIVAPYMKNMNADSMGKFTHPIGLDIEHYKECLKLVNAYGSKFLENIDSDGKVRTRFNQIMVTGRVSSLQPNMQQIPAYELVQTNEGKGQRYRNCFKPPVGYKFVSSDYVSQELVVIAHLTQDKNWIEAIRKKQDLHSIASELVFGSTKNPFHISWKAAAQSDCAYYKLVVGENGKLEPAKQKCKCHKHKVMRDACKNINFGLAYGMTEYRLAAMMRISLSEARSLIRDYFIAMPAIGKTMTALGRFGMRRGYIQTLAPFFRKRWFPDWKWKKQYIDEHLAGIRPDRTLSEIDKAAKNQPIQGSSADITKVAVCMVMWELDEKKIHDTVKLVLQVHDQLDTVCRDDYTEKWKPRLTEIMEEAAKVVIPSGLLKAETTITDVWSK